MCYPKPIVSVEGHASSIRIRDNGRLELIMAQERSIIDL
jgi:hypothetical protein